MHYTRFFPRTGYFFDHMGLNWTSPYFWLPHLIGLLVVIVVAVVLFKALKKHRKALPAQSSEALELLKLKYVNGEIDEETYRKKLELLK